MLDKVLSRLKDEIGIDGTQGADISTVWKYIENILKDISQENNISITPVVDDKYKAYIWEYVKNMDDVSFYVKRDPNNQNPADLPEQQEEEDLSEQQQQQEDLPDQEEAIDQERTTRTTKKAKKAKKAPAKKPKAKKPAKEKKTKKRKAVDSDDDFEADDTSSESEDEEEEEEDELSDSEQEEEEEEEEEEPTVTKKTTTPTKSNASNRIDREPKRQNESLTIPIQTLDDFDKVDVKRLDYAAVESAFGSNLHIVASEKIQDEQLKKSLPPDAASLSTNTTAFLREILKTRATGYLQANLTKLFGLDGRSTGHYCKVLEEKGAITRTRVTVTGFYSNLCVHIRYKNSDSHSNINNAGGSATNVRPYNMNTRGEYITVKDICATIIALAKDAEAKTILARDVLYALGFETDRDSVKKWYNRCIHDLAEMGYVKKLKTQINGSGPLLRCIQLLKETMDFDRTANKDVDIGEDISYPLVVESINPNPAQNSLCMDLTLARQALLHIEESKEKGITQRDLSVLLNSDNNRVVYRLLEAIASKVTTGYERFCVCRHIEFEKRVRRYRYFSFKTYKKIMEDDDNYVYPPIPESEFDENKLIERNVFYQVERTRKGFLHVLKNKTNTPPRKKAKYDGPPRPIGRPPKKKPQVNQNEAPVTSVRSTRRRKTTISLPPPPEEMQEENEEAAGPSTTATTSDDVIMESKESTPCRSKEPTPAIEHRTSQEPVSSSQDSPMTSRSNATGDTSTKKSAFSILMASSRARTRRNTSSSSVSAAAAAAAAPSPLASSRAKTRRNTSSSSVSVSAAAAAPSLLASSRAKTRRNTSSSSVSAAAAAAAPSLLASSPAITETATTSELPSTPAPRENESNAKSSNPKSVVSVVKIPTSTLIKPKKPACARASAAAVEAAAADETATIIATEEMEEDEEEGMAIVEEVASTPEKPVTRSRNKRKTPQQPTESEPIPPAKTRKRGRRRKNADMNETASSSTVTTTTDSQPEQVNSTTKPKKKSLFDYFGKGKATKTTTQVVATPTTPINIEEDEEDIQPDTNAPSETMEVEQNQPIETTPEEKEVEQEEQEEVEEEGQDVTKNNDTNDAAEAPSTSLTSTDENERNQDASPAQTNSICKPVNHYLKLRKKALLKCLESEPIFYMRRSQMAQYREILDELSKKPTPVNVQRKTVWTACLELKEDGLAQTTTRVVRGLNGKEIKYNMLVRKEIDLDGEEFQELCKQIGEDNIITGIRPQFKKIQRYDAPIERLDERLKKIKKNLEESTEKKSPLQIKQVKDALAKFASNAEKIKSRKDFDLASRPGNPWRIIQYQSGYIIPKIPRVKVMLRYLLDLWSRLGNIEEQESFLFSTATIFSQMPCRIILQVIGVQRFIAPKVKEYLQDINNQDTIIDNFPSSILQETFTGNNSIRSGIRDVMVVLEILGIIEPIIDAGPKKFTPILYTSYKMNKTVDLYNFKLKKRYAAVQAFTIHDEESLENYWRALSYVTKLDEEIEEEQRAPLIEDPTKLHNFNQLYSPRSWTEITICSPEQLEILNSYIDKANFKTPVSDLDLCAQIASETKLQIKAVRSFYVNIQQKLDYQLERKTKKEIECSNGTPLRKRRHLNPCRRTALVSQGSIAVSRFRERGSEVKNKKRHVGFTENQEDIPVMDTSKDDPMEEFRISRRYRVPWTSQEDDILIYCYIVIKSRIKSSRDFRWFLIPQLLPRRKANGVRNRFRMLLKTSGREQIIINSPLWEKFYREGIRNGDIKDENPNDPVNFDLISFVEYFLTRLSKFQAPKIIDIPNSVDELYQTFEVHPVEFTYEKEFIEDETIFKSLNKKLQVNLKIPWCVRSHIDSTADSPLACYAAEDSIEHRQALMIKLTSVMLLLTPEEEYNPFEGYNVTTKFPESLRKAVYEDLVEQGFFIFAKRERSIPGTRYTLSMKFMRSMLDTLPNNMRQQARQFEKHLQLTEKTKLDADMISSGMMACMLNLISKDKLKITVHDREPELQRFEEISLQTKLIDIRTTRFDVNVSMVNNDNNSDRFHPEHTHDLFVAISKDALDVDLSAVVLSQLPEEQVAVASSIVNYLQERASSGAGPYQIKLNLHQFSDKDILEALKKLQKTTPPVIFSVGIEAERYVLAVPEFLGSWLLNIDSNLINMLPEAEAEKEKEKEKDDDDDDDDDDNIVHREIFINPSIWTSVRASITPLILERCKKIVVSLILDRPGITESVIARKLNQFMPRKDIRTVLQLLVEQKCLKVVRIASRKTKSLSIFGKTRLSRTIDKDTIAECTESSYWVLHDFYTQNQ